MPANNERRGEDNAWRNLVRRLEKLERKTKTPERSKHEEVITFSVIGDMAVQTSGSKKLRYGGQLVAVITTVEGAGTGDTEFDILLNGSALGSGVTIDAAVTDEQEDYLGDYRGPAGARVQLDITQAGMHPEMVVDTVWKG